MINLKWCGDLTEVPTTEGKLYLAHVADLASRRIPWIALSEHHDALSPWRRSRWRPPCAVSTSAV